MYNISFPHRNDIPFCYFESNTRNDTRNKKKNCLKIFSTCACFANIIVAVVVVIAKTNNIFGLPFWFCICYYPSRCIHHISRAKSGILRTFFSSFKANTCLTKCLVHDKVFGTCSECSPTNFIIKWNARTNDTYSSSNHFRCSTPDSCYYCILLLALSMEIAHFNTDSTYNSNDNIIPG